MFGVLFGRYLDRDAGFSIFTVSAIMFIHAVYFLVTSLSIVLGDQSAYAAEVRIYGSFANPMIAANGLCSLAAFFFIHKFFIAGMVGTRHGFVAYAFVATMMAARLAFFPALIERVIEVLVLMGIAFFGLTIIGFLKLRSKDAD